MLSVSWVEYGPEGGVPRPEKSQLNFGLAYPGRWHDFLWRSKIKSRDSIPSGTMGVALAGGWDGPNDLPSLLCSETRHTHPSPTLEKFLELGRFGLSTLELLLENKGP